MNLSNYQELREFVRRLRKKKGNVLLGVEGVSGAGKTSTCRKLAADLGCERASLDEFIAIKGGFCSYSTSIAKVPLLRRICSCESKILLLDGICLRQVLSKIRVQADAYVYVKRISTMGIWHDGLNLEKFIGGRSSSLYFEEPCVSDFRYHAQYKPHEKAVGIYAIYRD